MLKILFLYNILLLHLYAAESLNAKSRYEFANAIFKQVSLPNLTRNLVISPAAIQTIMALTFMGANGQTAKELHVALHLESFATKDEIAADYRDFLYHTVNNNNGSETLEIANGLFVDDSINLVPEFKNIASKYFHTDIKAVNFSNAEAVTTIATEWIKSKTHDRIASIDGFNSLANMLLINSIYFKAEWLHKFDELKTKSREFIVSKEKKSLVPMMLKPNVELNYIKLPEFNASAIELPYKSSVIKMLILLPDKVNGLNKLEKKLNLEVLMTLSKRFRKRKMEVHLPKFKIEFDIDLVNDLKELRIMHLFSSDIDLTDMMEKSNGFYLPISTIVHKVFFEVDEHGTEAAASTTISVVPRSFETMAPLKFICNHPFMFAIKDDNAVYFIGHVLKLGYK